MWVAIENIEGVVEDSHRVQISFYRTVVKLTNIFFFFVSIEFG